MKIISPVILTLITLITTGCASNSQFYYKTGQLVNTASCDDSSWSECYRIAGKICQNRGYDVLEKNSSKSSGFFSSSDKKELVYLCKESITTENVKDKDQIKDSKEEK